jgi:hypothetical protein
MRGKYSANFAMTNKTYNFAGKFRVDFLITQP